MMLNLPKTITIDGPVAAGKTTVGKEIAKKLNYLMVDTGFFYRTVTHLALKNKIDVKDDSKTGKIAETVKIELTSENHETVIIADGENITRFLRTPKVDNNVQYVAANPKVRRALTPQMRKVAEKNNVVMVGRDIGTVVLPKADLKLWLDANTYERAKRRAKELKERGINISFQEVLKEMELRDKTDRERKTDPMKVPKDAIIINSNNLTIPQTIEKTYSIIKNWSNK